MTQSNTLTLRDWRLEAALRQDLAELGERDRQRAIEALRDWDETRSPNSTFDEELPRARLVVWRAVAPHGAPVPNPRIRPERTGILDPDLLRLANDELRAADASADDIARVERELRRWVQSREYALPLTRSEVFSAIRGISRAALLSWGAR